MCSLHANSAADALVKLCTLPLLAGRNIDIAFVAPTVASAIDLVVHAELRRDGRRRVVEVVAPTGRLRGGAVETVTLFALDGDRLAATGELPPRMAGFDRAGVDPAAILRERPTASGVRA